MWVGLANSNQKYVYAHKEAHELQVRLTSFKGVVRIAIVINFESWAMWLAFLLLLGLLLEFED